MEYLEGKRNALGNRRHRSSSGREERGCRPFLNLARGGKSHIIGLTMESGGGKAAGARCQSGAAEDLSFSCGVVLAESPFLSADLWEGKGPRSSSPSRNIVDMFEKRPEGGKGDAGEFLFAENSLRKNNHFPFFCREGEEKKPELSSAVRNL